MPGSRKLGRASDHRKAMLRGMVTFLLENGKIETTVTRAKEVRAEAEKMISLGKANTLHTKRQVFSYITKEAVAKKLIDEIAPKYNGRNGGYTRIYKLGPRRGDSAEMAIIELVCFNRQTFKRLSRWRAFFVLFFTKEKRYFAEKQAFKEKTEILNKM